MSRLVLSRIFRTEIERQARAAVPRECCGLLEGVRERDSIQVRKLHETRNLACDVDGFEIDPADHFRALHEARAAGHEIVGCYHSHPNGETDLSQRDRETARDEQFVWLIVAIGKTGPVRLSAHLLSAGIWQTCTIEQASPPSPEAA